MFLEIFLKTQEAGQGHTRNPSNVNQTLYKRLRTPIKPNDPRLMYLATSRKSKD